MNRALNIKNWSDGGNNYVLKGNPRNKWVGFQESVLFQLIKTYGDNFNIIIWTDETNEDDYYCIPFNKIKYLFTDQHKTSGKYPNRWTSVILEHQFRMHSNSNLGVDISSYYSKKLVNEYNIDLLEDFLIENFKAEINIRLGQSKFRNGVLKNFDYKCALSEISELDLLRASHIIPWSHKKEFRGDISNGICLYAEYDALFDRGFISFNDSLEVIISPHLETFSKTLIQRLQSIKGRQLRNPTMKDLKPNYLNYHRANIFIK